MKVLTRHREVYNIKTRSQAFDETGSLDNSKVNKKRFTPNNLKELFLGANGIAEISYITNETTPRLINYTAFSHLPKSDDDIKKASKEDKGMIDAVLEGLQSNNLEGIYFFTGGFENQEELDKELKRLYAFCSPGNRQNIDKSLKRLVGVGIVEADISALNGLSLINKEPMAKQLQANGIQVKPILKLEPERNEYGLLKNREINIAEYPLDANLLMYFAKLDNEAKAKADAKAEKSEEKPATPEIDKLLYAKQLMVQGFKVIGDSTEVAGGNGVASKVLGWLKNFSTEKEYTAMGYKFKANQQNEDVLLEKGITDVKGADIWSPKVFTLDEDVQFRVFVREDDISFTVLIKLPLGMRDFEFDEDNPYIKQVAQFFSNTRSAKGEIYQSCVTQTPRFCYLKNTRKVDCSYGAVEFVMAKDLYKFKQSNWSLLDYIKACQGTEQNAFSSFPQLSLGSRIVVGAKPGGLKAEIFDCSGKYQSSGMIGGQAGSGKTAMFDSLLVQFLALKGVSGDGAAILLDAKQEWIPAWRKVFTAYNVPFYGFDGGLLTKQNRLLMQTVNKGKITTSPIKSAITQEVAGIIFARTLYEIIQGIQKQSCGAEDVKEFNEKNVNYNGIKKLPRIAILVDEINTLHSFTKDPIVKAAFSLMTGGANLTRTSGFMWMLGGQNPAKSIIPSNDVGSLKYNIFGTMDPEIYEYFGVKENQAVIDYEQDNGTDETPHPIMSQGMFYAGPKGKTELVKCLYIDKKERAQAIELIGNALPGMFQLDAIVKYALANHLFDNYTYGVGAKNNLIFAALRDIGIITDLEFEHETARLFNIGGSEEPSITAPVFDDEEIDLFGTSTQTQSNPQNYKASTQTTQESGPAQRPQTPQGQQQAQGQYQQPSQGQQQSRPQQQARPQMAETRQYEQSYTKPLIIPQGRNPFEHYGNGDGVVSTINSLKEMTKLILADISSMVGGLDRVNTFRVTNEGLMIINGIAYQPQFDQSFLQSLPFSIQGKVSAGKMVELFDFNKVYQLKNLQELVIDNQTLAQGRLRRELGLHPRERFNVLFKTFRHLQHIKVGTVEYNANNPDADNNQNDTLPGYSLKERIKDLFTGSKPRLPQTTDSSSYGRMDKFWDSKMVRTCTNALGWTVGTKLILASAAIFGPWSLLFGGLLLASQVSEYRKANPKPPQQQPKRRQGTGKNGYDNDNVYGYDNNQYNNQNRRYTNNGRQNNNPGRNSRYNNSGMTRYNQNSKYTRKNDADEAHNRRYF